MSMHALAGIYAAAVTPLMKNGNPDYSAIPTLLEFLARRGCHGALLLGTTGEGPSFSPSEKEQILQISLKIHEALPKFRLFAGTGTPSLQETIDLTKSAFDLGFDGVVVLPPYYYRDAPQEGLYQWFNTLLQKAVPRDGVLLGYHIPQTTGIGLELDLLSRIQDAYPNTFMGIKDSGGNLEHTRQICKRMGADFLVFVGHDSLLNPALGFGATGCITALANLCAPELRAIWDAHQRGNTDSQAHQRITAVRAVMDNYKPFPPSIKALMARLHHLPYWLVRPPLTPLSEKRIAKLELEFANAIK